MIQTKKPDDYMYIKLEERIAKLEKEVLNPNIIKPLVPTHSAVSNYENYGNSYYYKVGTRVHIHLGLKIDTKEYTSIFILPEGYRPYSSVNFIGFGGSGLSSCGVSISPSGNMSVQTQAGYGSIDLDFDAVS